VEAGLLMRSGEFVTTEIEIPAVTEPGFVLVRNLVSTVCGSDVHAVYDLGLSEPQRPGYPGHESVSVVTESSDPAFAVGDLVLAVPNMIYAAGFAEYQLLPSSLVILLPPGTEPAVAIIAQQLGTVIFGMKRFWSGPGTGAAVILGSGPVGLYFTWLCARAGFDTIIVSDPHPERLEIATRMGATVTVIAEGDAVIDVVNEITDGGAALVIDAAGKDVTRVQAIHCVQIEGRIGMFGMPEGAEMTIPFEVLFRRKPQVDFCWDAQAEPGHASFREALEAIRTGAFDTGLIKTKLWPLAELTSAIEAARAATPGHVKFGVTFG